MAVSTVRAPPPRHDPGDGLTGEAVADGVGGNGVVG